MTFNHGVRSSTLRWSTKPVAKATGFSFDLIFVNWELAKRYGNLKDMLCTMVFFTIKKKLFATIPICAIEYEYNSINK